jgi:GNAT superfamily N-acetyltransferase
MERSSMEVRSVSRAGDMSTRLEPQELPPGYPKEYQREAVLHDGRRVFIRPILPGDAPELAVAIRSADPGTIRGRFLGGPPRVTAALLQRLTEVDYVQRFALVAIDPASEAGVAVARYEPASEGVAEIAVAVRPEWRRVGLGTLLITLLAQAAAERGVCTFSASYLAENRPVTALVEDAGGFSKQVIKQGIAEVSLALDHRRATGDLQGNAT